MTPNEHYQEALDLLDSAQIHREARNYEHERDRIAEAQVHATLALYAPPPAEPEQPDTASNFTCPRCKRWMSTHYRRTAAPGLSVCTDCLASQQRNT